MEFRSNAASSGGAAVDTKLELTSESPSPAGAVEKEHMFDKVVTPSDVGKLNRLVIPKQHAEKYFPLDSSSNEKGLLLNFEDRTGKQWRFRYSYWNSSQSYVMTKGWSRFVKEKKLDPGDAVSFHRGSAPSDRHLLFIDWRRRRPDAPETFLHAPPPNPHHLGGGLFSFAGRWMRPPPPLPPPVLDHMQYMAGAPPPHHHFYHQTYPYRQGYIGGIGNSFGGHFGNIPSGASQVFYLQRTPAEQGLAVAPRGGGGVVEPMLFDSMPPVGHHGKAGASGKRLRLFGVNMECPASENTSNEEEDSDEINNNSNSNSEGHNPLQLRLYNGTPIAGISTVDCLDKGKSSVTTFNFDI